ncbi:MAG: DUF423 domain-containing protein [Pirellulaceae bacterium]
MAPLNYCQRWLTTACLLAALAVLLGAFGAHGLSRQLTASEKPKATIEKQLDQWETAVRYHMYHALALMVVSFVATGEPNRRAHFSGGLFLAGMLVFSGGLYGYVLTGWRPLVLVVPVGGVAFIGGWLTLACSLDRSPHSDL